jgi:hypothetical protein
MKGFLILIIILLIVAFFIEPIFKLYDKEEEENEVRNFKN